MYDLPIHLPDLEDTSSAEIHSENLIAVQGLYFAAMLEEMGLFHAVDQLAELFLKGQLPLARGNAGQNLYRYWKHGNERLSVQQRRNLYTRTFGFPGGEDGVTPNREFNDLWTRFIAAVAESSDPHQAGLDLAQNLSQHGFGIAHFASMDLQAQIREMMAILSDPEIGTAFGARSLWAVVELLGGKQTARYRNMATSGSTIIGWLAKRRNPTQDLKEACEAWLAAAAIAES
jgi:hypothetical protein